MKSKLKNKRQITHNVYELNKTNIVFGPASKHNIPVMYAFFYTDICLDTKSGWTDRQMDEIPLYPQSLFVGV